MNRAATLERIREVGVIPVLRSKSADLVRRAVAAVRAGGVPVVEITMTVPGAIGIIEQLRAEAGADLVLGAGTVLDTRTAGRCLDAGADFVVSPATFPAVIACCREREAVVMPGALTPTEIADAWALGADIVKVFPADAVGGAAYLKALKGPLPHIRLVPTGGVSLTTAAAFIHAGAEAVGVGGDLVDFAALERGGDAALTERARQFVDVVARARRTTA